ncbi:uncharacterized protein AB675_12105 [Cyphellophora attinorum]|uniref:Uncharacterized protein n=1 Tax=Cyphellophora attinorum TaxID=1664694 RepID=A0A0N1HRF3_9EURO|nr:uncharacterized protein AB675_12105 [Phialophora attinorum]KPI38360.1 hypothetical protein AB675_12105 [Phialophora attinorum]
MAFYRLLFSVAAVVSGVHALPVARNDEVQRLSSVGYGDMVFDLGGTPYLAVTTIPSAQTTGWTGSGHVPMAVIKTDSCSPTAEELTALVTQYLSSDDVLSESFLQAIYVATTCSSGATLESSAVSGLMSMGCSTILASPSFAASGAMSVEGLDQLEPGPYVASLTASGAGLSMVYRLYEDRYRTFIFGAYPSPNDESTYMPFPVNVAKYQDPLIPVPSKIYSWSDPRPFAGLRVSIKDLYDIKGLQSAGGSRAWASITPVANASAVAIQRIIDLGGHLVGKQKTAQFASGADPWDWYDVQYPFNPRGDEWLTCSASSSGGGCSIAAYDWLDHAIGSDTGSSGMISLQGVQPLGAAQDTAGVFARDPHAFAYFAKHWYTPSLHQDSSINGLEALNVPSESPLPRTLIYTPEYLPTRNPAADTLVQSFITNLTTLVGLTKQTVNLTATILDSDIQAVRNTSYRNNASSLLNQYTQWTEVGRPLVDFWAENYDGRFPPIDPARRPGWIARTQDNTTSEMYTQALAIKRSFSDSASPANTTTAEKCANSGLWLYDIGTGGLPSYREEDLIVGNLATGAATYLNYTPPYTITSGVNFCSFAGCADFTVPIGQVEYFSNVTQVMEMVPVTLSLVMRRGCDWSLFALIEALAEKGGLRAVKTGREAF